MSDKRRKRKRGSECIHSFMLVCVPVSVHTSPLFELQNLAAMNPYGGEHWSRSRPTQIMTLMLRLMVSSLLTLSRLPRNFGPLYWKILSNCFNLSYFYRKSFKSTAVFECFELLHLMMGYTSGNESFTHMQSVSNVVEFKKCEFCGFCCELRPHVQHTLFEEARLMASLHTIFQSRHPTLYKFHRHNQSSGNSSNIRKPFILSHTCPAVSTEQLL